MKLRFFLVLLAGFAPLTLLAQSAPAPAQGSAPATEQTAQTQIFINILGEMFQKNNGMLVCAQEGMTLQTIGDITLRYLKVVAPSGQVNNETVVSALFTLFPCPFGPFRKELAPAKAAEVQGVWAFPTASQLLRLPPKSPAKVPTAPAPVNCDALAFYEKGEMRSAIVAGQGPCPFKKASDMDAGRKTPRVMSWSMATDGRMAVARTDIKGHVEEWDVLSVKQPFEQFGVKFLAGDLVMYLRRSEKNSMNISQEFRHLQRLN